MTFTIFRIKWEVRAEVLYVLNCRLSDCQGDATEYECNHRQYINENV